MILDWVRSLDRVLKGEVTKPAALEKGIELPAGGLTALLVILAAAYGACMGTFAFVSHWGTPTLRPGLTQMGFAAAKVPMLFFLTLAVTFPSLYVFNALVGCRLTFTSVLRLLVAALAVTIAVLASFGTIIVFFSLCTTSYSFMVLLNVVMFAVAGVLGMGFLLQTLHRLAIGQAMRAWREQVPATQPVQPAPDAAVAPATAPPPLPPGALDRLQTHAIGPHVKTVFRVWVLVFGLVGAQMAWVLRPFIGAPNVPVTFFRARDGNFFQAVISHIEDLAVGQSARPGAYRGRGAATEPAPATQPSWDGQR